VEAVDPVDEKGLELRSEGFNVCQQIGSAGDWIRPLQRISAAELA
jgi:hypothetical protein